MIHVLQKKSKIFLHFLFGIAIPCLWLSYFAYRGIQNDRALFEQQLLQKNQLIAQRIVEKIHFRLGEIEQKTAGIFVPSVISSDSLIQNKLDSFKINYPLIEDFFLFNRQSRKIDLPSSMLLFTIESRMENYGSQQDLALLPGFADGIRFEFQTFRYDQAVTSYQSAFSSAKNRKLKGEILNAIARVQKKAAAFDPAIRSYQTLSRDYRGVFSFAGIPFELAARMELGFLYGVTKDTLLCIQRYFDAYNDLLNGTWALDKSRYNFWSVTLQDSLTKIFHKVSSPIYLSYFHQFQAIQANEAWQQKNTDRLLKFQQEAGNALLRKLTSRPAAASFRIILLLDDQKYFISLPGQVQDDGREFLGIIWNEVEVRDSLLDFLEQQDLYKNKIIWKITDEENQVILHSEHHATENTRLLVTQSFIENFPDWTLALYHQNPNSIEALLASRRSIYFYIFILIAGILAFGLYLSIRSVSHELEFVKMKSDFVSGISHELKSPLTSIRQLAEMLQRGRVPSEERRQKYYDVIVEQSERLSLLINNVLDFAKMEAGKRQFKFELTDMSHFLTEIIAVMQQQVSHDEIEVKLELAGPLPEILIDRSAISQAVNNLLENAIKYSDRVKKVIIQSYLADKFLLISVTDFGIGIKREDMEKIFERFCRGDDVFVRSKRGSGLGLTLVKQIVRAHRGAVEVQSEYGKGSTFTMKLPIS